MNNFLNVFRINLYSYKTHIPNWFANWILIEFYLIDRSRPRRRFWWRLLDAQRTSSCHWNSLWRYQLILFANWILIEFYLIDRSRPRRRFWRRLLDTQRTSSGHGAEIWRHREFERQEVGWTHVGTTTLLWWQWVNFNGSDSSNKTILFMTKILNNCWKETSHGTY